MHIINTGPIQLLPEFEWLRELSAQNMANMFDLAKLLPGSVFYPASADDGKDIEYASRISQSFVHVDYSLNRDTIKEAMEKDFHPLGYDLINILEVPESSLTPDGWHPTLTNISTFEQKRLRRLDRAPIHNRPFAL